MKKIVVKCPRCGKEEVVEKAYYRDVISCEHCNFKHQITKKTNTAIKIAGYVVSMLLMLVICLIVTLFIGDSDEKWLLGVIILGALIISPLSNYFSRPVIYFLGLYEYEPIIQEEKSKKSKKK